MWPVNKPTSNRTNQGGCRPHFSMINVDPLTTFHRICLIVLVIVAIVTPTTFSTPHEVFTNSFHVRFVRDVSHQTAHEIAKRYGFVNHGSVSTI